MRGAIAVTGLGAVSALGHGVDAITRAMIEGVDGIREMTRVDVSALHPVRYAGWLHEAWARGEEASLDAWVRSAAQEAWRDAGVAGIAPERIAVVSGTTLGEDAILARSADVAADAIGARGPRWTISTACASSANAIGLARDLIERGDADVVLAGGAEKLVMEILAGFAALGVLAGEHKCAPFGEQVGTTLGEGAGFVVLERAGARSGQRARAFLLGYGLASDGWHETSPEPRGDGVCRATAACLRDAGLDRDQVDYVNAHATGTAANDDAEWRGIARALGPRAKAIPVSASKGYLGHAQGAAGVLEAIATITCMEHGLVPPSARVGRGRPHGPSDTVGETGRAREGRIEIALSNSAAFAGANAVLAFGRTERAGADVVERVVSIDGIGVVRTADGAARDDAAIVRACGDVDLRNSDPSSRFAIAAAAAALAEAGVRVRGEARERTGVFGGCGGPPRASIDEYRTSLDRGIDRASAPAFARTVAHAPLGAVSVALGARGPSTMVVGDGVAGLLAIAYAVRSLAHRTDADRIVAGGLDERATGGLALEGAAFVVATIEGTGPRVVGVATAGSHELAIARALAQAGRDRTEVQAWLSPRGDQALSFASALTMIDVVRAVREGATLAVASASGPQGTVALVLARPD